MRIAVIGASGMLGRHAVEAALAAGHDVVAAARDPKSLAPLQARGVEVRAADLDDGASLRAALADVDAVINGAGYYPTVPQPWRAEVDRALIQMDRFYDACAARGLSRIVYVGGAIALPRRADGRPADETADDVGQPASRNPYVQVKWALDRQARDRAADGLPVVVGIPTMSLGEYDPGRSTARLVLEMARGTLPGYVEGRRNVVYAGDAGRGLVLCAEAGARGERYLLAGENLTMTQLMDRIAAATGRARPRRIPLPAARLAAAAQALRYTRLGGPAPTMSATAIAVMAAGQFIDGGKALRTLGFRPMISTDEAIARTLRWLSGQGLLTTS